MGESDVAATFCGFCGGADAIRAADMSELPFSTDVMRAHTEVHPGIRDSPYCWKDVRRCQHIPNLVILQ